MIMLQPVVILTSDEKVVKVLCYRTKKDRYRVAFLTNVRIATCCREE